MTLSRSSEPPRACHFACRGQYSSGWLRRASLSAAVAKLIIRPHENFLRIRHLLFAPGRHLQPYWLCNHWSHGAFDQRLGRNQRVGSYDCGSKDRILFLVASSMGSLVGRLRFEWTRTLI